MCRTIEQVYLKGFYEGVMLMGPCAGEKVCDAKAKVRQDLIDRGEAMPYFEPESLVMSRCVDPPYYQLLRCFSVK